MAEALRLRQGPFPAFPLPFLRGTWVSSVPSLPVVALLPSSPWLSHCWPLRSPLPWSPPPALPRPQPPSILPVLTCPVWKPACSVPALVPLLAIA